MAANLAAQKQPFSVMYVYVDASTQSSVLIDFRSVRPPVSLPPGVLPARLEGVQPGHFADDTRDDQGRNAPGRPGQVYALVSRHAERHENPATNG